MQANYQQQKRRDRLNTERKPTDGELIIEVFFCSLTLSPPTVRCQQVQMRRNGSLNVRLSVFISALDILTCEFSRSLIPTDQIEITEEIKHTDYLSYLYFSLFYLFVKVEQSVNQLVSVSAQA